MVLDCISFVMYRIVTVILGIWILVLGVIAIAQISSSEQAGTMGYTVVIDAGHGGKDRGASSKNGTYESDINLAIAGFLKKEFESRGVTVVMTREDELWLASSFAPNKKRDDMNNRRKIIENAKPDLVISVHLNNFPSDTSVRGLQCFYDASGEVSQKYAVAVQTEFNKSGLDINRKAKAGDYYILDCTAYPSILIECGFLSNAQEEKLLKTKEYQQILAFYIASAVTKTHINATANIMD